MKHKVVVNTQLLVDFMRDNNLSKAGFCRLCHIPVSTLNTLLKGSSYVNAYYIINIKNKTSI